VSVALPVVRHSDYDAPLQDGHRFPMRKFSALGEILAAQGLLGGLSEPELASRAQLARAHDPAYVDAVLALDVPREVERRIGLPITADVVRRSRRAVGGTLHAAELALQHGIAVNAAGGSHHAGRAGGAGFCVFNDVAVAALDLLSRGAMRKALVIDLDVHQGDGTADIFAHEPAVFTLSVHGQTNFPTRKASSDLDIGLPRGADDFVYLAALHQALAHALATTKPDLVFYNAGVDPHMDDTLGHLALSDDGLAQRDEAVFAAIHAARAACVVVAGGGYGPDPDAIAARHAGVIARAANWRTAFSLIR
jgi:acetoin utilization deacetylase AcuC-like enzyme